MLAIATYLMEFDVNFLALFHVLTGFLVGLSTCSASLEASW